VPEWNIETIVASLQSDDAGTEAAPAVLDHTLALAFLQARSIALTGRISAIFIGHRWRTPTGPIDHYARPRFSGVAQIYPLIRIENAGVRRKDRFFTDFLQVDEFES